MMIPCTIKEDMIRHRKLSMLIAEGRNFCHGDITSPRAHYFGLHQVMKAKSLIEIKLLVQVPDSFIAQIKEIILL